MATAIVKLPDGRRAKIKIPDGMSMEEATGQLQSMYDSTPEAFQGAAPAQEAPAPEQQPQMPERPVTPTPEPEQGMLSRVDQFARKFIPPYGAGVGVAQELQGQPAGTELESYGAGLVQSGRDMLSGGRQAFNKLTGDDAELAQLNEQEATSREQFGQRTGDFPISAGVGRAAGSIGAPVAAAAALPGTALAGAGGMAARMLMGAGAGAAGGYAQPLTPEEEAGGSRERSAMVGGAVGAAAPVAAAGLGKALRAFKKVGADEAVEDFAERQLGATHAKGAEGAYKKATGAIEDKADELGAKFKKLYTEVEGSSKGSVKLTSSSGLSKEALSLPEEVSNGLSPTARRITASLERGSTKVSQIVDKSGKPIADARSVSFADVRDTVRDLRRVQRKLPYNDPQSLRIDNIIERLDDDLQAWGKSSDEAAATLKAAKGVDAQYAKEVAPLVNKKDPVGKFRQGTKDEGAFDKTFLKADKGQNMSDLLRRVPDAKAPARELYGQKLLTPSGPTLKRKTLESSTVGEAVLSKSEREYLKKVSDSIGADASRGPVSHALTGMIRTIGLNKANKILHGVEKYGSKAEKPRILADMLRAYAAGKATSED